MGHISTRKGLLDGHAATWESPDWLVIEAAWVGPELMNLGVAFTSKVSPVRDEVLAGLEGLGQGEGLALGEHLAIARCLVAIRERHMGQDDEIMRRFAVGFLGSIADAVREVPDFADYFCSMIATAPAEVSEIISSSRRLAGAGR